MDFNQLRPNAIVRGPIFPEPVQVLVVTPMGQAVKVIGKGMITGQVYEPILAAEKLALLEAGPEREPYDGDPARLPDMILSRAFQSTPREGGDGRRRSWPRSDERGNVAECESIRGPDLASMGPRSDERGNHVVWRAQRGHHEASMGPRSDERGNTIGYADGSIWVELQWGHARMSVETMLRTECLCLAGVASMGPRSDERGNHFADLPIGGRIESFNGATLG